MTEVDVPDGAYTVVVDTVEDGLATLFFERDGEEVGDAVVDAERLPADGRHADAILTAAVDGGALAELTYDPERTESRAEAAQDRFDRLASRLPSERDDE